MMSYLGFNRNGITIRKVDHLTIVTVIKLIFVAENKPVWIFVSNTNETTTHAIDTFKLVNKFVCQFISNEESDRSLTNGLFTALISMNKFFSRL